MGTGNGANKPVRKVKTIKMVKKKKKKSKYEVLWEDKNTDDFDFWSGCMSEEETHETIEVEEVVFEERPGVPIKGDTLPQPKEYIIKAKAPMAVVKNIMPTYGSYGIQCRTPADLLGVAKKRVDVRKKKNKERRRARASVAKLRDVNEYRRTKGLDPIVKKERTDTQLWKKKLKEAKEEEARKAAKVKKKNKYTKEQKTDFRNMKKRHKERKKRKKKERQALRAKTEADFVPFEDDVKGSFAEEWYEPNFPNSFIPPPVNIRIKQNVPMFKEDNLPSAFMLKTRRFVREQGELIQQGTKDVNSSIAELLSKFGKFVTDYKDAFLAVMYLHQMVKSNSFMQDSIATASYMLAVSDKSIHSYSIGLILLKSLRRYRDSRKDTKVRTEALSDNLFEASKNISMFVSGELISVIRDVVLLAVSWKLFSKDISSQLGLVFGKVTKKLSLIDTVSFLLECMAKFARMGELIVSGVPITNVFMGVNPTHSVLQEADFLVKYESLLYYGLPVVGGMCARDWAARARRTVQGLEFCSKKHSPFTIEYRRLNDSSIALRNIMRGVNSSLNGGSRQAPIAFVIHGDPGIGKSSLVYWLCLLYSHIKGRKFDATHVFERVTSSPYWDRYDSASTPFIHYSEVGAKATHLAKNSGDEVVRELTSVIDTLPYVVDMSDVKDKGKVYCNPEMVIIDTNNPDMNISYTVNNVAAYERRFIYIEPIVKKEYRVKGSTRLDPDCKSEDYFDKWNFNVYTKEPLSVTKSQVKFSLQARSDESGIKGLEKLLTGVITGHLDQTEKHLASLKDYDFVASSESSRVSVPFHYCKEFVAGILQRVWALILTASSLVLDTYEMNLLETMSSNCDVRGALSLFTLLFVFSFVVDWSIMVILGFCFLIRVDYFGVSKEILDQHIQARRGRVDHRIRKWKLSFGSFKDYIFGRTFVLNSVYAMTLASSIGAFMHFYKNQIYDKIESESANDTIKREELDELDILEDQLGCGKSYQRIAVKNKNKLWNVKIVTPSLHTTSLEGLHALVMRNARKTEIVRETGTFRTYVLGVKGNYALVNRHAFGNLGNNEPIIVKVSAKGGDMSDGSWHQTVLYPTDVYEVESDIVLIQLNGLAFKDIFAHFPHEIVAIRHVQSKIGAADVKAKFHSKEMFADDPQMGRIKLTNVVSYQWASHKVGYCGLPLVGKRDKGCCILGLHSAGVSGSSLSFAVMVDQYSIRKAIELCSKSEGAPVFSESEPIIGNLPHFKSPVRYENLGNIEYFGSVAQPNMNQRSKLERTLFSSTIGKKLYDCYGFVRRVVYEPPLMKPKGSGDGFISPYNVAIRKYATVKKALDPRRLDRAIDIYTTKVKENLSKYDIPQLKMLTMETAINGVVEDPYIRRIDMSKAAGYGTPGKKNQYASRVEKDGQVVDVVTDEIRQEVLRTLKCYQKRQNAGPVYKIQLKDEPRDRNKVAKGKTRPFCASSFAFLIVARMALAPFYSLMLQYPLAFYAALGIDMHRDADKLHKMMSDFSKNIVEGDYGGYDTSMSVDIGKAAATVILFFLRHFGYTEEMLTIAAGVLSDGLFPIIEIIGEIFRVAGLQPSGKYATAEDNCIKNILTLIYLWLSTPEAEGKDFFEFCLPLVYGDDLIMSVDEEASFFNNIRIRDEIEVHTNMTFTPANKTGSFTVFVSPDTMEFLKRTFEEHPEYGKVMGVLSLDSVYKSLEWRLPSSVINEEAQMEQTCESALRELFLRSTRVQFDDMREYFISELYERYQINAELSSYDEISADLCPDAKPIQGGSSAASPSVTLPLPECDVKSDVEMEVKTESDFGRSFSGDQGPQDDIRHQITLLQAEVKEYENELTQYVNPLPGLQYRQVKQTHVYTSDANIRREADNYFRIKGEISAREQTIERLWQWLQRSKLTYHVATESEDVKEDIEKTRRDVREKWNLLTSLDGAEGEAAVATFCNAMLSSMEMDTSNLQPSGDYETSAQNLTGIIPRTESEVVSEMKQGPYDASAELVHQNITDVGGDSPQEKEAGSSSELSTGQANKLMLDKFLSRPLGMSVLAVPVGTDLTYSINIWENFLSHPSIRAKLRNYAFLRGTMKVKIAVSGTPFHFGKILVSYQPLATMNKNLDTVDAQLPGVRRPLALTYLSQAKGATVIDVKANEPLVMTLPYISPQPMMRLFNLSPLILPSETPYTDSVDMGRLYVNSINTIASASATPSPLSIFIYAWMEDVELGAPTGTVLSVATEADERKTGPIEKFATRASEIAYALTSVPSIAPFAQASGVLLQGVSELSSLFGFSVPTMNNEPMRTRPDPYQNGANVIGYDTGKRITLDPMQELSVDPRATGTDLDEMSLAYLCSVESYLGTFAWDGEVAPLSNSIWLAPVTPMLKQSVDVGAGIREMGPTALSFAAAPFEYWRGDITYRFEIVCSAYHRGKLAFYFEPNIAQNAVIDTILDLNKQYVKIIDIQDTQDVTFCVEWAFPKAWAKNMEDNIVNDVGNVGFNGNFLWDSANGYVAVTPFTSLQSPDGSPIEVNVYVSSDNMMFNQLTTKHMPTGRPTTESEWISGVEQKCVPLNESTASVAHISEEHFGEMPTSFRALVKRFCGWTDVSQWQIEENGGADIYGFYESPIYPPPSPAYDGTFTTNTPHLITYLRYAYLGIKGGIKHRFSVTGNVTFKELNRVKVSLLPPGTAFHLFRKSDDVTMLTSSMVGTVDFVPTTNGGIEFETPLYTNNLFGVSFSDDAFPPNSMVEGNLTRSFKVFLMWANNSGDSIYALHDVAGAEDFSLMKFNGAPCYLYNTNER